MTFFTQSSTTPDTTPKSFTKIDWDLVKQNVTAFDIYRQLANQTGISLQECLFNNKVDLSPYEIEDPEIDNYISSVPLFNELEKKYPFTTSRRDSRYPTTHVRHIAANMIKLSIEMYKIWDNMPVTNDNDRRICLKMLKKLQSNQRDRVLLETFTRIGIELNGLHKYKIDDLSKKLPNNRDKVFRFFGEYGHKNIKTNNAVRYPISLTALQIWDLCREEVIDPYVTEIEVKKIVESVSKRGIDYAIENKKKIHS